MKIDKATKSLADKYCDKTGNKKSDKKSNKFHGSSFESFLIEEGILGETNNAAITKVLEWIGDTSNRSDLCYYVRYLENRLLDKLDK